MTPAEQDRAIHAAIRVEAYREWVGAMRCDRPAPAYPDPSLPIPTDHDYRLARDAGLIAER